MKTPKNSTPESKEIQKRERRNPLQTDIEFIGDFDIVIASGINLSEGGICFELAEGLPFEMRFEHNGTAYQKRARLTWVKRLPEGGYRFGLTFIPPEPHPTV